MKNSRAQENRQSKEPMINNNKPRPENKDNLDSRENLEINDVPAGHNKKDTHEGDGAKNEHNDKRGTRQSK
jgi:hypothetical protein